MDGAKGAVSSDEASAEAALVDAAKLPATAPTGSALKVTEQSQITDVLPKAAGGQQPRLPRAGLM